MTDHEIELLTKNRDRWKKEAKSFERLFHNAQEEVKKLSPPLPLANMCQALMEKFPNALNVTITVFWNKGTGEEERREIVFRRAGQKPIEELESEWRTEREKLEAEIKRLERVIISQVERAAN